MSNYSKLKRGLKEQLNIAKDDKVVGPITLRLSMTGNREPEHLAIMIIVKEMCFEQGFKFRSLDIYNDEGWSRLIIELLDNRTLLDYVEHLEKELKGP